MKEHRTSRGLLLFLTLLICMAAIVFIGTEVFQVDKITITGSETLDNGVIINLSGILYGDNIFKISKDLVKERLQGNAPFLIVSGISFKYPSEVVLSVKERVPAAVIPYLSSYIVIDRTGFIIDITKQMQDVLYPVIEGVRLHSLTKGTMLDIDEEDKYKQKVLLRVLEGIIERDVEDVIKIVDMKDPDNIVLMTRDDIQIALGQALELDRKLGWLVSDGYTEVLRMETPGVMDVSVPGKAVFRSDNTDNSLSGVED